MALHNSAPHNANLLRDARGKAAVWLLLLVLVAGAAFAVWYFVLRKDGGGGASKALAQRVLPASADLVGGVDLERLLTNDDVGKLLTELGADRAALDKGLSELGIKPNDLGALVFGATMDGSKPTGAVLALEAKTDANAVGGLMKMLALQLPGPLAGAIDPNSMQTFTGPDGRGVFLVGSGAIFTEATAQMKGGTTGTRKAELGLIADALGSGSLFWAAGPVPGDAFGGMQGKVAEQMLGSLPSHVGAAIGLSGDVTLSGALHIPGGDAKALSGTLKTIQGMAGKQAPAAIRPLLEQLAFGGTGPVVTATLKVDAKTLASLKNTL